MSVVDTTDQFAVIGEDKTDILVWLKSMADKHTDSYEVLPEGGLVLHRNPYRRAVERIESAQVWVCTVVYETTENALVFSSEEAASAYADTRDEPCVISSRVVDHPEFYYGRPQ